MQAFRLNAKAQDQQFAMRVILHHLPRSLFANMLLASQACLVLSLLSAASRAENVRFPLLAQASEPLPLPAAAAETQEGLPPECSAIVDPPLSALSTDIQPRNNEGQIVSSENLPADCAQAQHIFADKKYLA